jgi:Icc protein
MAGAVRLLQLTDCHLKASPEAQVKGWVTEASLAAVVEAAFSREGERPAAVLATGDITQDGSPEAYARFQAERAREE